jgi:DNA-binding transcriptional regulator YdaS (Cro superfamily)
VTFRDVLQDELDRRCAANNRYSLRAFARALAVDHSTLSQILRGKRRLTARNVCALGRRMRLSCADIAEHCAAEHEAAVLAAVERPGFRADSRWVSAVSGIPLDEVNVALQRLLRKRMMTMSGRGAWERIGPPIFHVVAPEEGVRPLFGGGRKRG